MRTIIKIIGYLGIIILILPSILFLAGKMELDTVKTVMIIATIIWFGASIIQVWDLDKKLLDKQNKMQRFSSQENLNWTKLYQI